MNFLARLYIKLIWLCRHSGMLLETGVFMIMPGTIKIIINPSAGSEEPIEDIIRGAFKDTVQSFEMHTASQPEHIFELAGSLQRKGEEIIAVYGGDGTVMEVAKALHGSDTAMFIIPGGTANVMAKELSLPLKSKDAVQLLASGNYQVKPIDMGIVNGCPFLIRVNLGILADMITETSDEMKEKWGQWAYGITAFQQLPKDGHLYEIIVDGKTLHEKAVAVTITNAGNIGKTGYSFLPGISIADGWLDLIILDDADFLSLLKVTGSMLMQQDTGVLKHVKAKEIILRGEEPLDFLCDDKPQHAPELKLSISPSSLKIAFPNKTEEDEKD